MSRSYFVLNLFFVLTILCVIKKNTIYSTKTKMSSFITFPLMILQNCKHLIIIIYIKFMYQLIFIGMKLAFFFNFWRQTCEHKLKYKKIPCAKTFKDNRIFRLNIIKQKFTAIEIWTQNLPVTRLFDRWSFVVSLFFDECHLGWCKIIFVQSSKFLWFPFWNSFILCQFLETWIFILNSCLQHNQNTHSMTWYTLSWTS